VAVGDHVEYTLTLSDGTIQPYEMTSEKDVYKIDDAKAYLEKMFPDVPEDANIEVSWNESFPKQLEISSKYHLIFTEISPRLQMIFGCYHMSPSSIKTSPPATEGAPEKLLFQSIPILNIGHVLYLMSNVQNVIGVSQFQYENHDGFDTKLSIAFKYADFIYPGIPVVSRHPGYWISCRTEDLANVEFTLTDFMFHPVKIANPIHLSIEVEYINNPLVPFP
jgi:hypothetical protein